MPALLGESANAIRGRLTDRAPLVSSGLVAIDRDGDEPSRGERLQELRLAQRLLSRDRRSLLFFDEMEDLLSEGHSGLSLFGQPFFDGARNGGSKVFMHRLLERAPAPTLWVKLHAWEQGLLVGKRRLDLPEGWFHGVSRGHYDKVMRRLLGLIGQEKPRFEAALDVRDLFKVFVVEPQQFFERIRAQSGAFLISAFHERFERDSVVRWNEHTLLYRHYTLSVPSCKKGELLEELALLGVTREAMFPGLDEAARAITESVMSTPKRRASSNGRRRWHEPRSGVDVRW